MNAEASVGRTLRILVEHGSTHNLGDTAMLEGVVNGWLEMNDSATLFVHERPLLQTRLWSMGRVEPVKLPHGQLFAIEDPTSVSPGDASAGLRDRIRPVAAPVIASVAGCMVGRLPLPPSLPVRGARWGEMEACADNFDALHIAGGGNLTDTFPQELWARILLMHAFAVQKKPVLLTGQQIGPFATRHAAAPLLRVVRSAAFVGLREPGASVDWCNRAGLGETQFGVMGDDSLGLPVARADAIDNLLARHDLRADEFLAVNLRFAAYSPLHRRHLGDLARLVSFLAERYRLPVVVVPVALNPFDSDVESGRLLADALPDCDVRVLPGGELTPELVKGLLKMSRGAVGMSYHFCLFALSQGVPAVALYDGAYYCQKAEGLALLWGDERLALGMGACGTRGGERQVRAVLEDDALRTDLGARAQLNTQAWRAALQREVTRVTAVAQAR